MQIEHAIAALLEIEKTVVEGAGAAAYAAVVANPEIFAGRKVGIVLSGGNVDMRLLSNVILRELSREGRILSLVIEIVDRPGCWRASPRWWARRAAISSKSAQPHDDRYLGQIGRSRHDGGGARRRARREIRAKLTRRRVHAARVNPPGLGAARGCVFPEHRLSI